MPPPKIQKILAMDPTKGIPEKPDPSSPVIAPTIVMVLAETTLLIGTTFERATPKSFTIPLEFAGSILPKISIIAESPK